MQLGPRHSCDHPLVEFDCLLEVAAGRQQLRPMLGDQPIAGVGASGPGIVRVGFVMTAMGQVQYAPLQLQPGIRPHLLDGQLVLCLLIELIGAGRLSHPGAKVCQASQVVPGPVVRDDALVLPLRLRVAAFLEIQVGQQGAAVDGCEKRRLGAKVAPGLGETMQRKGRLGPEKVEVAGTAHVGNGVRYQQVGELQLGEVPGEQRVPIDAVHIGDQPAGVGRRNERAVPQIRHGPFDPLELDRIVGRIRHAILGSPARADSSIRLKRLHDRRSRPPSGRSPLPGGTDCV